MWIIKFKLFTRVLILITLQPNASQGSVDLSSLPRGSSVDGSLRIQLRLMLAKPRLRNFISSSTHCDNSIRGGRLGNPCFIHPLYIRLSEVLYLQRQKKFPQPYFLLARGVYFYRDFIISKSSLADFFGPSLSILSMASWVLIVPTFILFSKSLSKYSLISSSHISCFW